MSRLADGRVKLIDRQWTAGPSCDPFWVVAAIIRERGDLVAAFGNDGAGAQAAGDAPSLFAEGMPSKRSVIDVAIGEPWQMQRVCSCIGDQERGLSDNTNGYTQH